LAHFQPSWWDQKYSSGGTGIFLFLLLFQDFSNFQNNLLNHGKSITAFSIVNEDGLNLCHLFVINFEF